MKQKKPKSKRNKQILSLLLIVAILVTGAFAFLSATDSKTNVFTVGKVNIKLHENFDTDLDGVAEQDPESTVVTEEIVPGQTILKQPYVENTGKNEAWIFVSVGIPTATEDDIYKDDNQNINIEGRTLSMDVKAYAIQTGFTGNANETAKDVWEKYVENKQTELFGDEFTGDKTTRIQLFKTMIQSGDTFSEGYNDTNWDKITNAYMSTNDHDYYVFAYKTALAAPTNGNSPVTENVFDAVKLIETIGEGKPKKLNYFAPDNAVDLTDFNLDDCSLVKSETFAAGDTIDELYFEDSLVKDGYAFDWVDVDTNKSAYSGMTMPERTVNLKADYENTGVTYPETQNHPSIIQYTVIEYNGELALEATLADKYGIFYTSDELQNMIIPSFVSFNTNKERNTEERFYSADGSTYFTYTEYLTTENEFVDDSAALLSYNKSYTLPVRTVKMDAIPNTNWTIQKLIIPDTVKEFGLNGTSPSAGWKIKEIKLPYGLKSVTRFADYLRNLERLDIPNTVTEFAPGTLDSYYNPNFKSLIIPASVQKLSLTGFDNLEQLQINCKLTDSITDAGTFELISKDTITLNNECAFTEKVCSIKAKHIIMNGNCSGSIWVYGMNDAERNSDFCDISGSGTFTPNWQLGTQWSPCTYTRDIVINCAAQNIVPGKPNYYSTGSLYLGKKVTNVILPKVLFKTNFTIDYEGTREDFINALENPNDISKFESNYIVNYNVSTPVMYVRTD